MIKTAEQFVEDRLVPPLLHGDKNHQQWLREELRKWIPDLERWTDDNRCLPIAR